MPYKYVSGRFFKNPSNCAENRKYLVKSHGEKAHKAKDSLQEKNTETEKAVFYGEIPDEDYKTTVQKVSSEDVRRAARKLLRGDRLVAVYCEQ